MSVVIVGGNECMVRPYKDLCAEYGCKAKIYPKMNAGLRDIGTPDLLILFTNTVSHKMIRLVLGEKRNRTCIARCTPPRQPPCGGSSRSMRREAEEPADRRAFV